MRTRRTEAPSTGFRLDVEEEEDRRLRAMARLRLERERRRPAYERHPWPFLRDCIWTLDQASGAVRKFPGEATEVCLPCPYPEPCSEVGCTSYLHHTINRWYKEPRFACYKTRRMFMTWAMLGAHYWLARFRPNTAVAIGSRKQGRTEDEGSNELIKRIKFMHEHVPHEAPQIEMNYSMGRISFPSINSIMVAVAEGEDQLRQYTFTAILLDEMAFWEHAAESYSASIPTLEGGGRLTCISSAGPGFFKQLVMDELQTAGLGGSGVGG